jgi:hypothetical protein
VGLLVEPPNVEENTRVLSGIQVIKPKVHRQALYPTDLKGMPYNLWLVKVVKVVSLLHSKTQKC